MGRSKSVDKLLKDSQANAKRLKEIQNDLDKESGDFAKELSEKAKDFYSENNWEYKRYLEGHQYDFQTYSTWSLNNLSEIINKISESVIGTVSGEIVVPEGTKVDDDVEKINKDAGISKDRRLLIASNTFNLLSGLVRSFGSTSTIQISSAEQTIPIGQGLRIFARVSTQVTQEKGFFKDQKMCSYIYAYSVFYSLDEFEEEGKLALVEQLQYDLDALHAASQDNLKQYQDKEIGIEQYFETSNKLKDYTRAVQAQIAELKEGNELDSFLKNQMKLEENYIDQLNAINDNFTSKTIALKKSKVYISLQDLYESNSMTLS